MSEEIVPPEPKPKPKPKIKVGFKRKHALFAVIERKRKGHQVDYESIAKGHGVSTGSMRVLYYQWTKGMVDLGDPQTPEEREIDSRTQHERMLELVRRYKALVLYGFEAELFKTEDQMSKGVTFDPKKSSLAAMVKELKTAMDMQSTCEKGYLAILDELAALRERAEKQIGIGPADTNRNIIAANDEERALQLLNG